MVRDLLLLFMNEKVIVVPWCRNAQVAGHLLIPPRVLIQHVDFGIR